MSLKVEWELEVCLSGGRGGANHLPSNNEGLKETMMLGDVLQNHYSVVLCIHCFINIFLVSLHFNLMNQFSEGDGYQGIRTIKIFAFENTNCVFKYCDQ